MRVLQVTPRYFPNLGGVGVVVKKISELLVETGIFVSVYSMDLSSKTVKEQKINEVLVKRFKPLVGDPLYLPPPSFIEAMRKENVDIVHVHNAHTFIPIFVALSKRRRQKLVLQPHYHKFGQTRVRNLLLSLYKYSLDMLVFPRVKFTIANSPYERRIIEEDFPSCKNVVLIQEGISLAEIESVMWNPEKPTRILYVGPSLRRYKNVDKLLEAFAYLVKTKENPFKLVIVGDGPERGYLKDLSRKIGIENCVEWKRNLPRQQLLVEYGRAGVFVSLSHLESFSRVVHEAVLIGIPTVVRNFGATAGLVKKGIVEGVDSLNPEVIAEAIWEAARGPPPKTGGIQAFLSWEEYVERILDIYHEALRIKR